MNQKTRNNAIDDEPVQASGGKKHKVKQGEWLARIARQYKFRDWRIIWLHDSNKELREKRKNPDILYPGDIIIIPKEDCNKYSVETGQKKVISSKENIDWLQIDIPNSVLRHNGEFILQFDGRTEQIKCRDGHFEEQIPNGAMSAKLIIKNSKAEGKTEEIVLQIGHLDPVRTTKGVQARLKLLGFYQGDIDGKKDSKETQAAVATFQIYRSIQPIKKFGEIDFRVIDLLE